MTTTPIFVNSAGTTLAAGITSGDTSATLASGTGAQFPSPAGGQYFAATLVDSATGLLKEIVYVTSRSGDTVTMIRAQEGTTALAWLAGDIFAALITAGTLNTIVESQQSQVSNYAVDSGVADAYVGVYTPAIGAYVVGLPVRLKIANANSGGASTLDAGAGAQPIVHASDLSALQDNELVAGAVYEFVWDGTQWQLQTPTQIQTIINSNGVCRLYPDGWKEQSGHQDPSNGTFSFPVPFVTTVLSDIWFIPGANTPGGSGNDVTYGYVVSNSTYFLASRAEGGGFGNYGGSWLARGK